MRFFLVGTLILGSIGVCGAAEKKVKLAVLPVKLDTEMRPELKNTLDEILSEAFHQTGKFEVLGSSDIASMLKLQEQRMLLGTCADDSCMAEIGGALGVSLMAAASVGAVGERYLVVVKLVDVSKIKVLGRAAEHVAKEEREAISAVRRGVQSVIAEVSDAWSSEAEFADVAAWVALGLTLAAGGTGAVMAGLASSDASSAREEFRGTPDWQDYHDSAGEKALIADLMFGAAGAFAICSLVFFLLQEDRWSPPAEFTLVPTGDGGQAAVTFRF